MIAIQIFDHKKFKKRDQGDSSPISHQAVLLISLVQVSWV
jgi:hypothetical protein